MSATDIAAPPTVAELVAASAGREGTMLRICRDAAAQIEENIRQRIAHDASALGVAPDALARLLDGGVGAPVAEPAKRTRAAKPDPPADRTQLLERIHAEVSRGPVTVKALARRTGGKADEIAVLLRERSPGIYQVHGLKWSVTS